MQAFVIILTIKFGMSIVQFPSVTTISLEPSVVVLFQFFSLFYTWHDHRLA